MLRRHPIEADEVLLTRIRSGDRAAFARLFEAFYGPLCGFACSMVRSPQTAEDLVHDLFLNLWNRRADWDPEGPVNAYLFKATRNRALNHLKRRETVGTADLPIEDQIDPATPETVLQHADFASALNLAVSRLPEGQRTVFTLSRDGGLKYREIAEIMGISLNTVETQMGRALRTLRESLYAFYDSAPESDASLPGTGSSATGSRPA
jgi:RNA polymerase sigma-70 factor, ECF subfamily